MIIKSPMNALHNVTNPYQGKGKRVLCLCSAGCLRSPSCAIILQHKYGYNTRSAGVSDYALIPVSTALLEWADEIVCVEQEIEIQLMNDIQLLVNQGLWVEEDIDEIRQKTITLDIPDIYEYMNPTLQRIIIEQYKGSTNVS